MAAVAALGFVLSACDGGAGNSSAGVSAVLSSLPGDSSVATQGSTPTQRTAPTDGSSSGTATQSPTGSSGGSGNSGSSSGASNPPTTSTGNVTINWNPPTQNMNGSPLTNLAGFKIHYGTASQKYTQTITVSNPGLVTYVVADLSPGTYYFAVTAYSSAGTESPLSPEVSAKVN
jgi:hypothetical protein